MHPVSSGIESLPRDLEIMQTYDRIQAAFPGDPLGAEIVVIAPNVSVGAAYGVLVRVFQDGNLEALLDFHSINGIVSWLPLFLFVLLFGLLAAAVRRGRQAGRRVVLVKGSAPVDSVLARSRGRRT